MKGYIEYRNMQICKLYRTTKITQAQLAEKFHLNQVTINGIIKRNGLSYRNNPRKKQDPYTSTFFKQMTGEPFSSTEGRLLEELYAQPAPAKCHPCGLKMTRWSLCYGEGCHKHNRQKCQAFRKALIRHPELKSNLHPAFGNSSGSFKH